MAHLFNVDLLGIPQSCAPSDPCGTQSLGLVDIGLFKNVQSRYAYWTGTEHSLNSTDALVLSINYGMTIGSQVFGGPFQGLGGKSYGGMAMVLRDGDVAPILSPVPEPEPYVMLLAGLGLIGFMARRREDHAA